MAKTKVTFKIIRNSDDDWNIQAEYPGAEPREVTGLKSKADADDWMNGDRRSLGCALRVTLNDPIAFPAYQCCAGAVLGLLPARMLQTPSRSMMLIDTAPDAARYSSARFLFGAFASMAAIDSISG